MSQDALALLYDVPVDRIALRMLQKTHWLSKLPDFVHLQNNTPRVRPEDVTDIFREPPIRRNQPLSNQIPDHRLKTMGCYVVLGYADCSMQYRQDRSPSAEARRKPHYAPTLSAHTKHFWWVMEPDGTVCRMSWCDLRRLKPGQSRKEFFDERHVRKMI